MKDAEMLTRDSDEIYRSVLFLCRHWHNPHDLARSDWAITTLISEMLVSGDEKYPDSRGIAVQVVLEWALQKLENGRLEWEKMSYGILYRRFFCGETMEAYMQTENIKDEGTANARLSSAVRRMTKLFVDELRMPHETAKRKHRFIDTRYQLLTEDEKRILLILCPVRAFVSRNMATRAVGSFSIEQLDSLSNVNLLQVSEDIRLIQVHPEIRRYLLASLESEEVSLIHLQWSSLFEKESNYVEALYHCQEAGAFARAADILIRVRHKFGSEELPLQSLKSLLANFSENNISPVQWAHIKLLAGRLAEIAEDLVTAFNEFSQALRYSTASLVQAEVQFWLGRTLRQQNWEKAQHHFQLSKHLLYGQDSDLAQQLMVRVLISEAWLLFEQRRDFAAAEHNLKLAYEIIDPHKEKKNWFLVVGETYNAWGQFYQQQGALEKALDYSLNAERFIMLSPDQDIEQLYLYRY